MDRVFHIPLTLDFGAARPDRPYPVTAGVPFSRSVLASADHLRLMADGIERPAQVSCAAAWPDGSVKWALLDFFALPDENLQLQYGVQVQRQGVNNGIRVIERDDGFTVDTGPLKARFNRDGSGFIDEAFFQDTVVIGSSPERRSILDYVRVRQTEDRPTNTVALSGSPDPGRVEITTLTLEQSGPLHAVARMRGVFRYQGVGMTISEARENRYAPFTLRIHLWLAMSLVGVEHFFAYEGDPDIDFIRQIGLGFTVTRSGEPASVSWADDQGIRRVDGISNALGLYQASSDHFEIWREEGGVPASSHTGHRAAGWLDFSDARGGLAFGVRSFWQQYEKALHVDAATGRIDAWLWPPEAQTLDHRRYARSWGVGEDGAYNEGPFPVNYRLAAKGTGKSHELLFYFHDGTQQPEKIDQIFRAFQARPLALAPPGYYAETRVFGVYHAPQKGRFDDLEEVIQRPIDYLRSAQARYRWYGFFDYGDAQTCFATFHRHDRWENDFGRWGWANGDQVGRLNFALMLQFLRTGDRRNFEFAEANMRHVHDVDTTHSTEYPFKFGAEFRNLAGSAHRHNAQHWACPYLGSRGAHPMGARIHYFLTGSGRSKDILDAQLDLAERLPEGAANDGHGMSALSFLCAWERTGNSAYRKKTVEVLEKYDLGRIRGGWMAMISAAFGVFDATVEYTDLSGDDRFRSTVTAFGEMCLGPDIETNWTYPGGYFRIYAEALRYSLDPGHIEAIHRACRVLIEQMRQSASFLPSDQWPAPRGQSGGAFFNFSIDANTLRDLPYLMAALNP